MRNLRVFLPGKVHFITFRTEEGLPFVPLRFMNMLIRSALARAQRAHPVHIIAAVVLANHVHILIRVIDPAQASGFVGYFKTESSLHLNRLLNRSQRTVWAERFDSPPILDYAEALRKFTYLMLNPVKDGLVASMKDYPGVSSYPYLLSGVKELVVKSLPRNAAPPLSDPTRPYLENAELAAYFSSEEFSDVTLTFAPEELRLAFAETRDLSPEEMRAKLIRALRRAERRYQEANNEKAPIGAEKLTTASMLASHQPPINGRRMLCLSSFRELREAYIMWYRRLRDLCRAVYQRWKQGDFSVPYPPGLFAPQMPRLANRWSAV